jgi:cobalt transporter subunit CbtA
MENVMSLFRTFVFVAAVAGAIAGLALTAIQYVSTTPLILRAETFEAKAVPAPGAVHTHDHKSWSPDGLERFGYTTLANLVGGIGLALVLVALSEIAGGLASWRQGVIWGIGAFIAFTLAPSLSLPPELPGKPSAELLARQVWWVATVVLTAGGLALGVFQRALWGTALGVAFIVAPHIIGAPQPESFNSPVPHDIAQRFVTGAVLSGFVFWVLLGGCAGFLRSRLTAS